MKICYHCFVFFYLQRLPLVLPTSFSVIMDDALLGDGSVIGMMIATMVAMKETVSSDSEDVILRSFHRMFVYRCA